MEAVSILYPIVGIFVHCFELYLIIWKTPKFVQSKVPQVIRALLAIPINYITDESGLGFSLIPDLGDDWLDGKMKFLGEDSRYEIDHYFLGLVWVSPINLAAILHIQYANLRCVTLDEFKQPLWRYRLNVGFIYFFSVVIGWAYPTFRSNPDFSIFSLFFQFVYTIAYVGSTLKFSLDIWQSFSPWKEVRVSENTRKMQRKIFLAIQVQTLIPFLAIIIPCLYAIMLLTKRVKPIRLLCYICCVLSYSHVPLSLFLLIVTHKNLRDWFSNTFFPKSSNAVNPAEDDNRTAIE